MEWFTRLCASPGTIIGEDSSTMLGRGQMGRYRSRYLQGDHVAAASARAELTAIATKEVRSG